MYVTPGSPSKFLMAAFVRIFAQKVTALSGAAALTS